MVSGMGMKQSHGVPHISNRLGALRQQGPCSLHVVPVARAWAPGAPGEWEGWGAQREEGQTLSKENPPFSSLCKAVGVS